jgi:hypothetical protein
MIIVRRGQRQGVCILLMTVGTNKCAVTNDLPDEDQPFGPSVLVCIHK